MTKMVFLSVVVSVLAGCSSAPVAESPRGPNAENSAAAESYLCTASGLNASFTAGQTSAEVTIKNEKVSLTCGTMNVEAAALLRYAFPKADKFAAVCTGQSLGGSVIAGPTNTQGVVRMSVALFDKIRERMLGNAVLNCVKKAR